MDIGHRNQFSAHSSSVTCLAMGQKSARVMVSGGEDKKVNLWAVGTPNCILSLTGHTSTIECAKFSYTEDLVCAGSVSGALKVWDLENTKLLRTLTGHKTNVRSVDFHPYGEFLASGSLDTNIKLWDIRKKDCMYTYKGHSKDVLCLKFSPDGRWLASGGCDGSIKLWDLPAGKILAELKEHTAAITDVAFHPNEFLLASSSVDGTVKFWDLESFNRVSTTVNDAGPIRKIIFHNDGKVLFSCARDALKSHGWEPARVYDTVFIGWGKVSDIAINGAQLIAGAFSLTNITVFDVDLKKVQPIGSKPLFGRDNSVSRPFDSKRIDNGIKNNNPEVEDDTIDNYREIFKARTEYIQTRKLSDSSLSLSSSTLTLSSSSSTLCPSFGDKSGLKESVSTSYLNSTYNLKPQRPKAIEPLPTVLPHIQPLKMSSSSTALSSIPLSKLPSASSLNHIHHNVSNTAAVMRNYRVTNLVHPRQSEAISIVHPVVNDSNANATTIPSLPQPSLAPPNLPRAAVVFPEPQTRVKTPPSPDAPVELIPETRDHPAGLDMVEFLPKHLQDTMRLGYQPQPEMSESEAMAAIIRGHKSLITVISHRRKNIHIVLAMWSAKDSRHALEQAIHMEDQAVIVDILNVIILKPAIWTLDMCQILLPSIYDLLQSKYECYMTVGCSALKLILKNFAPIIKTNITAPPGIGVDISREERYNKCIGCYNQLLSVRAFILKRQTLQGKLGRSFRELSILMQNLE